MSDVPPRDLSLDSFRGLVVLLMVLVNLQGADTAFAQFRHADWDGMTLADLVFPWFLLIGGLSLPLALTGKRKDSAWPAILRRALLLFAIGVVLGWLIRPSFDLAEIRWTGVLQRIAIVYLACAAVVMAARNDRQLLAFASGGALLLLILHSLLLLHVGPPGGAPSIAPGEGLSAWLDQHFLPGRAHRGSWDPEGLLSTLPAIASGLIGVAVTAVMRGYRSGTRLLGVCGLILIVGGGALTLILPLNKNLWTASFTLMTAGLGLITWTALRMAWPFLAKTLAARLTLLLGQAALTFYIIHMLLIAVLVRNLPADTTLWSKLYGMIEATGISPPIAALLFALLTGGLCIMILHAVQKRGWILRL